ncbi:MAG: preprotein translocase subunit YajC [Acidobacteria bacterium]|nr:MAG: preprotein translocase subunit YajC [Acidobacteriota bacterium]PIE90097.1 MAG: preprotein translocase subunit YajC [Acidobacteriota bacterium]
MIPWLVLFALMYFFYLRPNLKQQKEQRNMLSNLKAGDKIITNGGIWGDIDSIDDQRIRLKVADKVKITISRNCVHALQSKVTETDKKS